MRRERCMKCDYFKPVDNEFGECYRMPPNSIIMQNRLRSLHPEVKSDDFCGEYSCLAERRESFKNARVLGSEHFD